MRFCNLWFAKQKFFFTFAVRSLIILYGELLPDTQIFG